MHIEDEIERNCLNFAVKNGTLEMLTLIIQKGAKIIAQRHRFSLVNQAVASNKFDILRRLFF